MASFGPVLGQFWASFGPVSEYSVHISIISLVLAYILIPQTGSVSVDTYLNKMYEFIGGHFVGFLAHGHLPQL